MAQSKFVKPAPGCKVRRPESGFEPIPESGCWVSWSPYYQRRLIDGDIVECSEPTEKRQVRKDTEKVEDK